MMIELRHATAATPTIGPFLDDTDFVNEETGLTIAQADVRLSKNGGDIAQKNESSNATHDELGYYGVPLDATDTDTLGELLLAVHEAGAIPVWERFSVITQYEWDRKYVDGDGSQLQGTVQGEANGSVDLEDHTLSDGDLVGCLIAIYTAAGKFKGARICTAFDGTTNQRATVSPNWSTNPASGSSDKYIVFLGAPATEESGGIADDLDTLLTRLTSARAGYLDNLDISENVAGASAASDIESALVVALSDLAVIESDSTVIESDTTVLEAAVSDVESSIVVIRSDLVVLDDAVSDVESSLVIARSDLAVVESDTAAIETATATAASDLAAIESEVIVVHSETTVIQSDTTAIEASGGSLTAAQASQLSQVHSDAIVIASDVVDIYSDTTAIESGGGSLTPAQASQLSQVHSDAVLLTGAVSDVESSLVVVRSDLVVIESDTTAIEGAGGGLSAAQASQLSQVHSDAIVLTTATSDVESSLVILRSDLLQVYSDTTIIASDVVVLDDALSDVESSLVVVRSDLVVVESDTTAIETATSSAASDLAAIESELTQVHSETTAVQSDAAVIESQTTVIESDVALLFSAHAEPTGVPAANEAPVDKLAYLFMALRNRVDVTASKKTFYDDGGTAEWEKDLSDNGTTYSETEANAI